MIVFTDGAYKTFTRKNALAWLGDGGTVNVQQSGVTTGYDNTASLYVGGDGKTRVDLYGGFPCQHECTLRFTDARHALTLAETWVKDVR